MRFFDSHAHYYDERFAAEYPGGADAAIAASVEAGCIGALNAGTNAETSEICLRLAEANGFFWASVGIHPEDCEALTGTVDEEVDRIRVLCSRAKAVAIGEIGLDYHWDIEREIQKRYFAAQLELAREVGMPVIIHDRDAHGDVYDIIRDFPDVKIVLHSFSGSAEAARQLCRAGRYISFSGVLTYKNARNVHEAAAVVPDELMMVETDCPYLSPVPHRGEVNMSAYIPHVIEKLAEIRGTDAEAVAEATVKNTEAFFGIRIWHG